MKPLQLVGLGLVGLGLVLVAMADDSGEFAAVLDLSESEDGPVLKLAMKTNLTPIPSDATGADVALPPGADV